MLVDKLDATIEAHNRIPVDIQGSCVYQRAQQSVGIACDTQRGDLQENGIVSAAREPQGNEEVDQERETHGVSRIEERCHARCSVTVKRSRSHMSFRSDPLLHAQELV